VAPAQFILVLVYLWVYLGPSVVGGLGWIVAITPIQGKTGIRHIAPVDAPSTVDFCAGDTRGRFIEWPPLCVVYFGTLHHKFRLATAVATEARVRHTTECIRGIEVIKMSTWERPFATLIGVART